MRVAASICAVASAALLLASAVQAAAPAKDPTVEDVRACYEKAGGKDPQAVQDCLELELKVVQAEHRDATERVASMAKALDKPTGTRTRWNAFIQAGQRFDSFVQRECHFVSLTMKGGKTAQRNAELACRINYYRLRADILENRFLSAVSH